MKAKYKFQLWQDTVLTLLLISLMGYHLWGDSTHEWLGIAFLLLLLLHNVLNTHWYVRVFTGDYSALRVMQISVNVLLALVILTALASGLMLSRYALPDMPFHSDADVIRKIHMTAVHWGQVVIALHLGLHWHMLAKVFYKATHLSPTSWLANSVIPVFFIAISAYGGSVLVTRNLLPYLLMQVDFAFFEYQESKWLFYMDYLAVMVLFAYLTRGLVWWVAPNPRASHTQGR